MASQNSQGIQTLLDAEKEAQKIVAKAREYRNQRVKEARGEAAKEIDTLKTKRQQEFKTYEDERSGEGDQLKKEVDEKNAQDIEKIKASFEKNRQQVVEMLMDRVVEVDPHLHQNYKRPDERTSTA